MYSAIRLLGFLILVACVAGATDFFNSSEVPEPEPCDPTVAKSFHNRENNPIVDYCTKYTIKQQPIQIELMNETLENAPKGRMMGAPEVLTLGENFIHLIEGKKVIDIGTFTGASALAWALAAGEGGEVYTMDISMENFKEFGVPIISKDEDVFKRIIPVEAPALETLDRFIAEGKNGTFDFAFLDADKINNWNYYERCLKLLRKGGVILIDNVSAFMASKKDRFIAEGKNGTFDFAFLDADKINNWNYYERCLKLLRKGGVILIDNALRGGMVTKDPSTFNPDLKAIDQMNRKIFEDDRTYSALLNSADGIHIAFKKE
ncbi:O-methyltransferase [Oesophagostomum dentatum]|uniref:O-methyltransferase n=1 Tax=Oesophagostomum dentatum TaxID=61180 RepID=A0A0B1TT53_OESDE|nr:O-methyltransferase [Oesophagostomum dentatum]